MNTATLISIISGAVRLTRQLDLLHGQGLICGPLNPSRLSSDGSLFLPVTLIDSHTIDLEIMAHSAQEALSRNAAPGYTSDLYSLGVVLYRLLAGQLPFYDPDPLKVVHEIFTTQPQPPHEIQHFIGPQPDIPALSGMASQLRFNAVFAQLLGVFAKPEHPLVIFLDDLQWVDAASLAFIEATWKNVMPLWIGNLYMGKAFVHAFARNPEQVLAAATASQTNFPPCHPMNDAIGLWSAMAWYALARSGSPEQQTEAPTEIQQSLDFLKKVYADGGKFNVGHRIAAIEALQADIAGDLPKAKLHFKKAVSPAKPNAFNMDCGLISEIASECFAETDRPYSLLCLRKARQAYSAAQALALVKRIEESALYPLILSEDAKEDALTDLDAIDAMTVTRAVMALSREVELKNLLPKLLHIILEHSGAENACLVSRKKGKLQIEQVVGEMTPVSPIPEGLLNFVINTRESVYFDDIGRAGFPTDPYFESGEIKSVACRHFSSQRMKGTVSDD